jgi:PrtD family type I secretion system ABC transporter
MPTSTTRTSLGAALASCRGAFAGVALFSGLINILMLTGSFFMLQIYDRVIPSRSVPTLLALAAIAALLFAFQAILETVRARMLVRVGAALDERMSRRVHDIVVRLPLKAGPRGDGLHPLRDLDSIRGFLSSQGPSALFDLPWIPLYLGICFAFHVWLGVTALAGAILLVGLTLLTEIVTRRPTEAATRLGSTRNSLAEASRRNAEAVVAMGMTERLGARWSDTNARYLASQQTASDVTSGLGTVSRTLRMMLQSAVLAVGAWLVIQQEATAGIIIAGSILSARALAPVDLAIGNWRGFVAARQGWARLGRLLAAMPEQAEPMALPRPTARLTVEGASVAPPGTQRLVAQDVAFTLNRGSALAVIGPSGSGKSSLARMLVGLWPTIRGRVCLDGAALEQWATERLGRDIGYLPQDVELMAGTVAENIARFDPQAASETIIAAAKAAGVHELIVTLPNGYDTEIGEQGSVLSAGQQQRVALARALYDDPFLVVLDEPNSNLDMEGEEALGRAIAGVRTRGGIVVIVAHRPNALAAVDQVLVMRQGRMQAFGPREEVLGKVVRLAAGHPAPAPSIEPARKVS